MYRLEVVCGDADVARAEAAIEIALQAAGISGKVTGRSQVDGRYMVYTDGGYSKAAGIGTWAYMVERPDGGVDENKGAFCETTNNRMELRAVINVLLSVPVGPKVVVHSDSQYVVNGSKYWAQNWAKTGWKTVDGKPVQNRDLWEQILQLVSLHDVEFKHVPGHSGHKQNERCDEMCGQALQAAINEPAGQVPVDKIAA